MPSGPVLLMAAFPMGIPGAERKLLPPRSTQIDRIRDPHRRHKQYCPILCINADLGA